MYQETSRQAYESVQGYVPTVKERVFEYLQKRGGYGATDQEMQKALSLGPQTQTPSRTHLTREGFVSKTNLRRNTTSGRKAIVWVLTKFAI